MNYSKQLTVLTFELGALLLSSVVAKADSLSIVFDQSTQTVVAGDTTPLVFNATITDTDGQGGSTVYLGTDSINLIGAQLPSSDVQNDNFQPNTPISMSPSPDPSYTYYAADLFDYTISDPTTPAGTYLGVYTIYDQNYVELGTQDFSIVVTSPTPEPSSLLLLVTGLTGLAGAVRRKIRA